MGRFIARHLPTWLIVRLTLKFGKPELIQTDCGHGNRTEQRCLVWWRYVINIDSRHIHLRIVQ